MSAVCIITPVVIMVWLVFSAAVVAAASSLSRQTAAKSSSQRIEKTARKSQFYGKPPRRWFWHKQILP